MSTVLQPFFSKMSNASLTASTSGNPRPGFTIAPPNTLGMPDAMLVGYLMLLWLRYCTFTEIEDDKYGVRQS